MFEFCFFTFLSSHSTDSVPGYGRVGEAGGSSRSSETGKSQGYGAQRSPGPLLAKADNLGGYNNGATSYSGYQGGKAGQGFPQSSSGYPGGFERQQSYNSGASSNGLTGGYSRYCNLVSSLPPMYKRSIAVGVAAAVLTILQGKQVSAILTAAATASTPAARRRTTVPTSAPARRTTRRTRAAATPTRAPATSPPVSSRAAPATRTAPPQQAQGLQASSQENQETARLEVERLETVMTQRRLQAVLEPMVELARAQVAQMSQVWVCQQTPHCRALQRCL